jgi:hypothetical protein
LFSCGWFHHPRESDDPHQRIFLLVQVLAALPRANRVFMRIDNIRMKTRLLNRAQSVDSLSWISALE